VSDIKKVWVEIVETETGKVETRMGGLSERTAERVERGANINLDHEHYHVRVVDKNGEKVW
jgi:hypothetical protein